MAIIYQSTSSYSESAFWNDPNVWEGGLVPNPIDTVYMYGTRLTVGQSVNTSGPYAYDWLPWTGSFELFRVSSTQSLKDTGSLYVRTDRGLELKIDYSGTYAINSSTQYVTSASIDTSFNSWSLDIYPLTESWPSQKGGVIDYTAIMYQPPTPLIITGSFLTPVTCSDTWYIGKKASLTIKDAEFGLGGNIRLEDGDLTITGSTTVEFKKHYTSSTGVINDLNAIWLDNWYNQNFIVHGPEVRTTVELVQPVTVGDGTLTVSNTDGFAEGDYIFVGMDTDFVSASRTDDNYQGTAIYQNTMSYDDEGFRVAGISAPDTIYLQRYTGLDAKIAFTASTTEIYVDEERYQVGDKVVINNQIRTITTASIEDIVVKDYDFTAPGANLNDWETDLTRSLYFKDWEVIEGLGLTQFISATYRHIFIKDLFLDKYKVEAWISNLDGVTTGITTPGNYGVITNSPPQADQWNADWPRVKFYIEPAAYEGGLVRLAGPASMQSQTVIPYYCYTGSLPLNGLKKITVEASNGFLKGALEDEPIFEYYTENDGVGLNWGRVGLFTGGQMTTFVCTRFKVSQKYQKLTLDQATVFEEGQKVYGTGAEFPHVPGEKIIKLASILTTGSVFQDNLLYAYRGHSEYSGDSIYPLINAYNRTEAYTASEASNLDQYGYVDRNVNKYDGTHNYTDLGSGVNRSVILDLGTERTFDNIAWNDWTNIRWDFDGRPIDISGSNDGVNWTVISGSFYDNRPNFIAVNNLRDFTFPSQSFRYVRIQTNGDTSNSNRFYQWYVRYLSGSNRIYVNNTADYGVGSEIAIINGNTANTRYTSPANNGLSLLQAGTSSWVGHINDHYVVTNTGSNYLDLDRPFNETILPPEGGSMIVKVDRQLKFSGSWDPNDWRTGRIAGTSTSQWPRRQSMRNVSFQHMNTRFPFINSSDYGAIRLAATSDFFNNRYNDLTGCTVYNSYDSDFGFSTTYGHGWLIRHNFMTGFRYPMQTGTLQYFSNMRKPWLWTGNITSNMYSYFGVFEQNYAPKFYNYNINYGMIPNALPSPVFSSITTISPNYGLNNTSLSDKMVMIRNIGRFSNGSSIYITPTPSIQSIEEITLRENWIDMPSSAYWLLDHASAAYSILQELETPWITSQRRGYGFNKAYYTTNGQGINLKFPTVGYSPVNKIKNYNRKGYTLHPQGHTSWIQEPSSSEFRVYNSGKYSHDGAYTGQPYLYNYPILAMDFELQSQTASVDISFNYQIPATGLRSNVTYPGDLGGSDYIAGDYGRMDMVKVVVLKNGTEAFKDPIFATTTEVRNFTKTYNLEGPGVYRILLAQPLLTNYIKYSNISSRVFIPDLKKFLMIRNGFMSENFKATEYQIGRLDVVQTPQTPIFRLRGSRIR